MTELDPTHREVSEEARKRIREYLAGSALHETVGGYENDEDPIERK